jgi:hypothetical protein
MLRAPPNSWPPSARPQLPGVTAEAPADAAAAAAPSPAPSTGAEASKQAAAAAGAAAGAQGGEGARRSKRPVFGRVPEVGPKAGLLSCGAGATVSEVFRMVASERVHRVYVVDEAGRPVGVVTLTDLLELVSEACG